MKQLWYFSADWCGPCKQFGPVMDELAKPCLARPQGISIKKLNIDYTPDIAKRYGIKSVPTVILVENEQEKARFTGALPMQQVIDFYNQKNG
jgi:thioredoxin 1